MNLFADGCSAEPLYTPPWARRPRDLDLDVRHAGCVTVTAARGAIRTSRLIAAAREEHACGVAAACAVAVRSMARVFWLSLPFASAGAFTVHTVTLLRTQGLGGVRFGTGCERLKPFNFSLLGNRTDCE